jgi:hypothetical protein
MTRWRTLSWPAILGLTALVGCVGILCIVVAHSGCVNPGPPVTRPDPGTPRAGYCETVDTGTVRAALVLLAVALVPVAALAARRRPGWTLAVAAIVTLSLLADAVVATTLEFAHTI